jgi:parallel beta-helix repeat protein
MNSLPESFVSKQARAFLRSTKKEETCQTKFEKKAFYGCVLVFTLFALIFCSAYWASAAGTTGNTNSDSTIGDSSNLIDNNLGMSNSGVLSFSDLNITSNLWNESNISSDSLDYSAQVTDFLFWKNENEYYARNGTTGKIEYSGTDLSQMITRIVSNSTDGLLLCFKKGVYALSSTIDITEKNDIRITGAGKELTKFAVSADVTAFNVTGNPETHNMRFEISDCTIDGGNVASTKYGIYLKHVDSVQLHDLAVTCFDTHVYVEDCQKPSIYNVVVWSNTKFSYGLYFKGYNLDIKMHEVSVLHSDPDADGIRFENYDSIELTKVYVNPTVTRKGAGYGFVFANCNWVHLTNCIADGNGNAGYYISSGYGFYFTNCWSGTNLKGLLVDDADQIQVNACQFYSNTETGITITSANEVYPSCTITASHFLHNQMYGLELGNTNHTIVTGNHFTNNGIYGVYYKTGNDYATLTNNDATDNQNKNYDIYITTPKSSGNLNLEQNFGRIYQAP